MTHSTHIHWYYFSPKQTRSPLRCCMFGHKVDTKVTPKSVWTFCKRNKCDYQGGRIGIYTEGSLANAQE